MLYGEGLPAGFTLGGQTVDYWSGALDIVAHELTHGVTDYSSRSDLSERVGRAQRGVLGHHGHGGRVLLPAGRQRLLRADYLIGEDVRSARAAMRSMADPLAYGHPDHYSRRFTGTADNGGVHTNSGIANHAFYLAIEGGTNRTSGLSVQGVGGANREQIERVFYRAFTSDAARERDVRGRTRGDDSSGARPVRRQQQRRTRRDPGVDRGGSELSRDPGFGIRAHGEQMQNFRAAILVGAALSCAAPAAAQTWSERVHISVNGAFQTDGERLQRSVRVRERPRNRIDRDGLQGVRAASSSTPAAACGCGRTSAPASRPRTSRARTPQPRSTRSPHPFFFNQLREVTGDAPNLTRTETAVHVQAMYFINPSGPLRLVLSAGPSFFNVEQDLVAWWR